jgi:tRNA(adenine34) deaminase
MDGAGGFTAQDEQWMRHALAEAQKAARAGEVPVGAVLIQPQADGTGRQLAVGANRTRRDGIVHAHAELVALAAAERAGGDYRLDNTVMYVTVEPCLMCLGALHQARLSRVVYGCAEPKFGALSRFGLAGHPGLSRLALQGGLLAEEAAALLGSFFQELRRAL